MNSKYKINVKKLIIILVVFYCVFFDSFAILQLSIFDGLIISYTTFRLVILSLDILYLLVLANNRSIKSSYNRYVLPVVISGLISMILGAIQYDFNVALGVFTSNILLIFVIYSLGDNTIIEINSIMKAVYWFGLTNAVMCILQYTSQSLILPEVSLNGSSVFKAISYYGTFMRSCGFLFSGLDVGILLVFCLLYLWLLSSSSRFLKLIISSVLLFAIYTTKTRNVYAFLLFVIFYFAVFISNKVKRENKLKLFIVASMIMSIAIMFLATKIESTEVGTIISNRSLLIRFSLWQEWVINFFSQNPMFILFGNCTSQRGGMVTDNMYMNYMGAFGIIGLILLVRLFIRILVKLSRRKSNISYLCTVFITCLFPFSLLNLPSTFFMIYFPFMVSLSKETEN